MQKPPVILEQYGFFTRGGGGGRALKVKNVNFKVRYDFQQINVIASVIYIFFCVFFLLKTHFLHYFNDPRSFSRSKSQFQG